MTVNASSLEKPENRRFSHKNPKMFDFRFNTPTTFPESGSRKRFHALGIRAIDSPHKIRPRRDFSEKNFSDPKSAEIRAKMGFDPRKMFSEFFDARNRFLAQNYP